jgi:hypothetical protein
MKTEERGTHHHLQRGGTETRREGVRVMKKKLKSMNGPYTLNCNTLTGGRLLSMLRGSWRHVRGVRGEREQRESLLRCILLEGMSHGQRREGQGRGGRGGRGRVQVVFCLVVNKRT